MWSMVEDFIEGTEGVVRAGDSHGQIAHLRDLFWVRG